MCPNDKTSDSTPPLDSAIDLYRSVDDLVIPRSRQRYWLHGVLLFATIFTMLVMGARLHYNFVHGLPSFSLANDGLDLFPVKWAVENTTHLLGGVPFALTLIIILLAHEMGHYLYCRRYDVDATLPFFIPFPSLIGTLGAFIRIKSPIRSRAALFDIGIAGPIAGFVTSLIVLLVALPLSRPLPPDADGRGFGVPIIFHAVYSLLGLLGIGAARQVPLDAASLHPAAVAAWVGMFATALNLLPGGQLDGGHILYAISPRAHRWISRTSIAALILLAWYWYGWAIWAILLRVSGTRHPQVPPWPHVVGTRRWLALLALIMLVLTFVPEPFAGAGLKAQLFGIPIH